jgi:hypothetical protein
MIDWFLYLNGSQGNTTPSINYEINCNLTVTVRNYYSHVNSKVLRSKVYSYSNCNLNS